jgi:hypothetical protein
MPSIPCDTKTIFATLLYIDSCGAAASVSGTPVWAMSGAPIGTLTIGTSGLSATVSLNGTLGQASLTVTADVNVGGSTVSLLVLTNMLTVIPSTVTAGAIMLTASGLTN